jgi:DNA-cytosine methyltransferase
MNVLSLFDGMSCGRLALDRLDIKVDNYYAAEIDKYATQVSEANYPDIIRLGDVCKVKAKDLPKIDLILAGSPCQGFSFAGKQLAFDDPRSALFFEFVRILKECDPKYFLLENVKMKKEFLHIITQQVGVEPILINSALVSAQNRQRYYWTNIPGVEQPEQRGIVLRDVLETTPGDPTLMSDSFVARQKKNINGKCLVDQNKEKAASLSAMEYVKNDRQGDYLACNEEGVPQDNPGEFDKNLDKMTNKEGKAYYLTARYTGAVSWNSIEKKQRTMVPVMQKPKQVGTAADINGHDILKRVYSPEGKSPSLTANGGGNTEPKVVSGAWRGRYYKDGVRQDQFGSVAGETTQMLELRKDGKSNAITTVGKDSLVVSNELPLPEEDTDERIVVDEEKKQLILKEATNKGYTIIENGDCFGITHINSKTRRGRNMKYKCNTLTATNCNYMRYEHSKNDSDVYWRKLTPLECMRLQTVPDDYLMPVSNTQIYKMLGNGWTIEVIAHILQNMKTLEEGGEVAERKGQIGFEF